ncbi:MAG: hypothetical protein IJX14_03625 [Clostridia bacterium]|nr:hypothetical protein [Clostridia bacterium]
MIVTFCGHSQLADKDIVRKHLTDEIYELLRTGYRKFYLGGYGDFDNLAAAVLTELKDAYPDMERILILPYLDKQVDTSLYTGTLYPPLENVPKRFAISRRNKWVVEQSSVIVAYVDHSWGGAVKTLEHAVKKGLRIINLGGYQYDEM